MSDINEVMKRLEERIYVTKNIISYQIDGLERADVLTLIAAVKAGQAERETLEQVREALYLCNLTRGHIGKARSRLVVTLERLLTDQPQGGDK